MLKKADNSFIMAPKMMMITYDSDYVIIFDRFLFQKSEMVSLKANHYSIFFPSICEFNIIAKFFQIRPVKILYMINFLPYKQISAYLKTNDVRIRLLYFFKNPLRPVFETQYSMLGVLEHEVL